MANKNLATYLNNHLTASSTALELLTSIEAVQANTELARFAAELREDIKAEQQVLEKLMEGLEITKSAPRQAVGWLAEKFTQIKLRMDDSSDGVLYLLESLELMLVAIEGKRGLWRGLAHAAVPGLPLPEYERLAVRSEEQQQQVERRRLAVARMAFAMISDEQQVAARSAN